MTEGADTRTMRDPAPDRHGENTVQRERGTVAPSGCVTVRAHPEDHTEPREADP